MKRKIYVASSWRNPHYPEIVKSLKMLGHDVYDFRNPRVNNNGFAWTQVEDGWEHWTPARFIERVQASPIARAGFLLDKAALDWCDTCVCILPCGRSAHLELGYAARGGKATYVLLHEDKFEPELMYLLCDQIVASPAELYQLIGYVEGGAR